MDYERIQTDRKDFVVKILYDLINKGRININPDYQREYVMDQKKSSRLIESSIIGVPIPGIYLCEENNRTQSVIDGKQRLKTFCRFINNEFMLSDLEILKDLNGKYYKDLDMELQDIIDETPISTIIINPKDNETKYDVFKRLNTGSTSLNHMEIRMAMYHSPYLTTINDYCISHEKELKELFIIDNMRFRYQELLLRLLVLINNKLDGSIVKSIDCLLADKKQNNVTAENALSEINTVRQVISLCKEMFGKNAFGSPFDTDSDEIKYYAGFAETIVGAIIQFYNKKNILIRNASNINKEFINKINNDERYGIAFLRGTTANLSYRIHGLINIIDEIIANDAQAKNDEGRTFDAVLKEKLFNKQNGVCPLCNSKILDISLSEIDHIVAWSNGGITTEDNAQLVHRICNRHKSNSSIEVQNN